MNMDEGIDKNLLNHLLTLLLIQGDPVGNFQESALVLGYQDLEGPLLALFQLINKFGLVNWISLWGISP